MPLPAWAAGAIGNGAGNAVVNGIFGLVGQGLQNRANRKQARWERDQNQAATDLAYKRERELLDYQLDYNTPYNQMKRFKDAGLNPNLIYGQGSPGNMQSAPSVPVRAPAHAAQISMQLPQMGLMLQQSRLLASQADLLDTKNQESGVKQNLMRAQEDLLKANPYMRPEYVNALVTQLESTAKIKEQEAEYKLGLKSFQVGDQSLHGPAGAVMMEAQLMALQKRVGLLTADEKIKAKILESKEFDNALKDIQVQWMKNADVTPEHIRQFIMMFLTSLMRR